MIGPTTPRPFTGLPEADGPGSKSARMVANVRAKGAAVGRAVAIVTAESVGGAQGAINFARSPGIARKMAARFVQGAAAGALTGACIGGLVGGVPGQAIGALIGATACGLLAAATPVAAAAKEAGARNAAALAPHGATVGENAARSLLHGVAKVQISISHLPGMRKIGHRIIYREQVKMEGDQLERCHKVDELVYRGSQPGPEAWKTLADAGFKTIVNFRYETNSEADKVRAAGMTPVYIPQAGMDAPTLQQTLDFLKIATDPAQQPVYFHCYSGVDRTGTMAACYRIAVQGWTAEQAIEEGVKLGMVEDLDGAKIDFIHEFEAYWKKSHP